MDSNRKKRMIELLENQDRIFAELGFEQYEFKYEYNGFKGDVCYKGPDGAFYRIDHFSNVYVIEDAENEDEAKLNMFEDADLFDDSIPEDELIKQIQKTLLEYVKSGS